MKLTILKINNIPIAILESIDTPIKTVQDALDLLEDADHQGARKIMIKKEHLHDDFFDLKTGIAGEILQKIINYYKQLAVVGDFSGLRKKSWLDFMHECNKTGQIFFVESTDDAVKYLTK
ncbi:MAG: DUF4180 domain-containing protein [Candidatus Marinimicrobia bacterium]|nr:DUF4180 domain-containing protein [Candidatus Neomarinimicrobiota bacterium]